MPTLTKLLTLMLLSTCLPFSATAEEVNQLTKQEEQGGWELLFDGKSTEHWRNFRRDNVSNGWVAEDGALTRKNKGAGNIITKKKYENFEFSIEYRLTPKGNSGIMFRVTEEGQQPWHSGPEIQINDNIAGKDPQKAGWLYQLYPAKQAAWAQRAEAAAGLKPKPFDATRPPGEWNHVYLRVTPQQCIIAMNGIVYSRFKIGSDDWNKKVAASKFAKYDIFGKAKEGHICLQDHGDVVSFRNIKIRELDENGNPQNAREETLPVKISPVFTELNWDRWEAVDEKGKVTPLRPIVITHAGDGTSRLFVATQGGLIHVLPKGMQSTETNLFLDLKDKAAHWKKHNEEGLLGLAFHPAYAQNGKFYVYYSSATEPLTSVVSEFTVSEDNPNLADPSSERIVWKLKQPFWNHNGGTIAFGPDGYLYIGLGDGGSANDPFDNGQQKENMLGSVLRIDVDRQEGGRGYAIPADNPFRETPGVAPEIYATGFRNIWRLSFDRETGDLWVADVGQDLWEEINIVRSGGNYGWNRREGKHPFGNRPSPAGERFIDPVWEYDHVAGKSITGGYVYRGRKVPELRGCYVYADFVSGKIWALKYDAQTGEVIGNYAIPSPKMPVLTFAEDQEGELYFTVADVKGLGIYRFESANLTSDN